MMIDHGVRRIYTLPASHLRPPCKIHIFKREEEIVIQQPYLIEHPAAIYRRAATGTEYIGFLIELSVITLPRATITGLPIHAVKVARRVQMIAAIKEQHL